MDAIEELLTRGVANIIPGKEELRKIFQSGKKLNVYLGIDPTATHIHLGHAVPLRQLQAFAGLGHHVTFLIGDFTALIGDTSDKDTERPVLTSEEINENFKTYKKQAEKILDFSKVKVRHNSEWLKNLSYEEIIKLSQQFSLNDFMSRELIRKRLDEGKRVALHEVQYPIMQGYDSYFMDTDVQLGGTDQTFNMQAGRTLQKLWRNKESFVVTNEFLTGTDGRKMSKSWGNAIWLDDAPEDMYAKVMAIKDDLIVQYFTLGTRVAMSEVEEIKKKLEAGEHPMAIKKDLARIITTELHSAEDAQKAQENFEKTVQQDELPANIPVYMYTCVGETDITSVMVDAGLAESKSEAKRLLEQGGVSVNSSKINQPTVSLSDGDIIKVGKRHFIKIQTPH